MDATGDSLGTKDNKDDSQNLFPDSPVYEPDDDIVVSWLLIFILISLDPFSLFLVKIAGWTRLLSQRLTRDIGEG